MVDDHGPTEYPGAGTGLITATMMGCTLDVYLYCEAEHLDHITSPGRNTSRTSFFFVRSRGAGDVGEPSTTSVLGTLQRFLRSYVHFDGTVYTTPSRDRRARLRVPSFPRYILSFGFGGGARYIKEATRLARELRLQSLRMITINGPIQVPTSSLE